MLKTAWLMDTVGNKGARFEISAIKVATADWPPGRRPRDAGLRRRRRLQDFISGEMYANARILRFVDGPDEVHRMTIARREARPYLEKATAL